MEKPVKNYIVDVLRGVAFVVTSITALVIFFFLPSGVKQGSYQTFLGIMKSDWSLVHTWSGIAFIILGLVHLLLHGKWMIVMTKNMFSRKKKKK
jgi:hypothetical protein